MHHGVSRWLRIACITLAGLVSAASCQCDPGLVKAQGLVVTPPALDFGYVTVDTLAVKDLTLTNKGPGPVRVESATVTGDADFAAQGFEPLGLSVGESSKLPIGFVPSRTGKRSAVLVLFTNGADSRVNVNLKGVGVTGATDGGVPDGGPVGGTDGGVDGGTPVSGVGCADGTREGFLDPRAYPQIAGCSGAWSVPGLGMTSAGIAPACNRQGGNDSAHADGMGCSALDLCAAGWHVCRGLDEVTQKAGSCADAVPAGTPAPGLFFAVAQHSCTNSVCDTASDTCTIPGVAPGVADNDNDVFGCSGQSGTNAHLGGDLSQGSGCDPLNATFACTQSDSLCWNQAMPNIGPWQGVGSNSYDESDYVTKDGCQNDACSYSGSPIGPSDEGGVLCCAD